MCYNWIHYDEFEPGLRLDLHYR